MISCWEPSSPCSAWAPRPGVPPGAAATSQPPPPRPKRCCGGSARTWWNREETNGNPQGLGFFRFSRFFSHETVRFFVSMKPSWGFPYGTIGEHLDATKNLVWPVKPLGFSIEKHGGFNRISNTQNEETSGKIIGKNHQQIGFHHEASMKATWRATERLQPWRSVSNKNIESRLEHGTGIRIFVVQTIVVESWCWLHHFSSLQLHKVAMVPSHVCPVKPYLWNPLFHSQLLLKAIKFAFLAL